MTYVWTLKAELAIGLRYRSGGHLERCGQRLHAADYLSLPPTGVRADLRPGKETFVGVPRWVGMKSPLCQCRAGCRDMRRPRLWPGSNAKREVFEAAKRRCAPRLPDHDQAQEQHPCGRATRLNAWHHPKVYGRGMSV